jgi:hypothetical protein
VTNTLAYSTVVIITAISSSLSIGSYLCPKLLD